MKCFSTFARIMQKIMNIHSNSAIFDFLFYNATDYSSDDDENPIQLEDRTNKSKYVSGERKISTFLNKVNISLDALLLSEYLSNYEDIFYNEDNKNKIYSKFKKNNMPLNTNDDICDEIANLFSDILNNYADVLPTIKEYKIITDSKKNITDDTKDTSIQIKNIKDKTLSIWNKKIPTNFSKDFEFKYNNNDEIIWSAKSENAYNKYPLSYKIKFDKSNPIFDKIKDLRKILNEANLNGKYIELGNASKIEEFLGDFPHPYPEITDENAKNIKWFIGKEKNPKELIINLKLYNSKIIYNKSNIVLQLLSIDTKNEEYIFSNKWIDTWFDFTLKIKLDLRNENTTISYTYGIRKDYTNNIKYFKEYFQFIYLMNDKNSKLLIHATNENIDIINYTDFGTSTFGDKENNHLIEDKKLMEWIKKLEEDNNIKVNFDLNEFIKKRDILLILYNASNNKDTNLDTETTLILPNKNYVNIKNNESYQFGAKLEYIEIFGVRLNLCIPKSLNILAKIEIINDTIKLKFNKVWLSDDNFEFYNKIYIKN